MPLTSQSIYLLNQNRLYEDVEALRHHSENNNQRMADIHAGYIIKEVELLVKLLQNKEA